jgi:thiamine biosynthesis lipoprotein
MFSGIYSFHRIATAAIQLVIMGWFACLHLSEGDVVADSPQRAHESAEGAVVRSTRPLMGTTFNLSIWAAAGQQPEAAEVIQHAFDLVASLEEKISSWNPQSETSAVNRLAGQEAIGIGSDLHNLLDTSLTWARRTDGAFDITAGPLFDRWKQARKEGVLPTDAEIRNCLELTGYDHVILEESTARLAKPGMKIGFGAIGKGFATDRAATLLRQRGFENFIIDAGGDVLVSGSRGGAAWQVAIRDPRSSGLLAVHEITDCAIATSGDYEQFSVIDDVHYAHILDPRTGWPARQLASVTVITQRGTDADALATALFVMGPEQGLAFVESLNDTETWMALEDGTTRSSNGLHLNGLLLDGGHLEMMP